MFAWSASFDQISEQPELWTGHHPRRHQVGLLRGQFHKSADCDVGAHVNRAPRSVKLSQQDEKLRREDEMLWSFIHD